MYRFFISTKQVLLFKPLKNFLCIGLSIIVFFVFMLPIFSVGNTLLRDLIPTEYEKTFSRILHVAKNKTKSNLGETYDNIAETYFKKTHPNLLQKCIEDVKKINHKKIQLVLIIKANGDVAEVLMSTQKNPSICLRNALLVEQFPAPPF